MRGRAQAHERTQARSLKNCRAAAHSGARAGGLAHTSSGRHHWKREGNPCWPTNYGRESLTWSSDSDSPAPASKQEPAAVKTRAFVPPPHGRTDRTSLALRSVRGGNQGAHREEQGAYGRGRCAEADGVSRAGQRPEAAELVRARCCGAHAAADARRPHQGAL